MWRDLAFACKKHKIIIIIIIMTIIIIIIINVSFYIAGNV